MFKFVCLFIAMTIGAYSGPGPSLVRDETDINNRKKRFEVIASNLSATKALRVASNLPSFVTCFETALPDRELKTLSYITSTQPSSYDTNCSIAGMRGPDWADAMLSIKSDARKRRIARANKLGVEPDFGFTCAVEGLGKTYFYTYNVGELGPDPYKSMWSESCTTYRFNKDAAWVVSPEGAGLIVREFIKARRSYRIERAKALGVDPNSAFTYTYESLKAIYSVVYQVDDLNSDSMQIDHVETLKEMVDPAETAIESK